MPPNEDAFVREAKQAKATAIAADSNDLKANSGHNIDPIRRATRDAYRELEELYDDAEAVEAIELPSERLGEPESADEADDADDDVGEEAEETEE